MSWRFKNSDVCECIVGSFFGDGFPVLCREFAAQVNACEIGVPKRSDDLAVPWTTDLAAYCHQTMEEMRDCATSSSAGCCRYANELARLCSQEDE